MIALFKVDFLRLTSRRLFRWLTLLAIVGFLVAGTVTFIVTDDPSGARTAIGPGESVVIQNCVEDIERSIAEGGEYPPEIADDPETYCSRFVMVEEPGFHFSEMTGILFGLGVPFLSLAWLIGASAIGAEWPNRTITSQLTWEPRRNRVFAAKYLTAAVSGGLWVIGLCLAISAVFSVVAATKGTFDAVDSDWFAEYARLILRLGAGGALAAALGASLAMIGRNTAAALGAGFVYLAIVESLVRGLKPSWSDWLLGDNLGVFLARSGDISHLSHSQVGAGVVLLSYAAIFATVALLSFRAREIA